VRFRLSLIFFCVIGVIALFWYVGYRSRELSSVSQLQTPPQSVPRALSSGNATVLAAQAASRTSPKDNCPRASTDNGMLRLSLHSVSTTRQIGTWTPAPDNRFVIAEVSLEAITDFQLASSAVLWLVEEPDGTERSRSVATGALARPLASLSPYRGERVSGQVAFEVRVQTRAFKLHYDPLLARQLTLCVSIP
jgi:hypothetical protein